MNPTEALEFEKLCAKFNLDHNFLRGKSDYKRLRFPRGDCAAVVDEVKICAWGRFGNSIVQLINAIYLAERMSVSVIRYPRHASLVADLQVGGISFVASEEPLSEGGGCLVGAFFRGGHHFFKISRSQWGEEVLRIASTYLSTMLVPEILNAGVAFDDGTVTIHLRSGDIFRDEKPHPGYVQPPLSYYTLSLRKHQEARQITKVILVFEDQANPCVGGLQAFLDREGIPFQTQSGTLHEDLGVLFRSPHLIVGYGSFCWAIGLISKQIKSICCFRDAARYDFVERKGIDFRSIDTEDSYINQGEWENSGEQRELMLSYPEDLLRVK